MICRPWRHKWVFTPFACSMQRCAKCGVERRLTQSERKARYKRLLALAAKLPPRPLKSRDTEEPRP